MLAVSVETLPFDYLIDVVSSRTDSPIPAGMWRRAGLAAGAELREVARAAGSYFDGRSVVLAEVFSWLTNQSGLLVLTGDPGSGKTILTNLALLADPETRNLLSTESTRCREFNSLPSTCMCGRGT